MLHTRETVKQSWNLLYPSAPAVRTRSSKQQYNTWMSQHPQTHSFLPGRYIVMNQRHWYESHALQHGDVWCIVEMKAHLHGAVCLLAPDEIKIMELSTHTVPECQVPSTGSVSQCWFKWGPSACYIESSVCTHSLVVFCSAHPAYSLVDVVYQYMSSSGAVLHQPPLSKSSHITLQSRHQATASLSCDKHTTHIKHPCVPL